VSTTGTDGDWIVKVIDVYRATCGADGALSRCLLAGDILRAKFATA
jgi:hypothetical protein